MLDRILTLYDLQEDTPMPTDLALRPEQLSLMLPMARAGQAADAAAARRAFAAYRDRLADATRRRQDADLACWSTYLAAAGASNVKENFTSDPDVWKNVTWGLVAAFVEWQLQQGYAIGSVNVRLSTVKTYAKLATKAGSLDPESYALIKTVAGFRHTEGKRLDARRNTTRKGLKKAEPIHIGRDQVAQLKRVALPRDRLLMCLLLDHGLRVGEVASLTPACFELGRGTLTFYRQKVDMTQTHRLTADTLTAAEMYLIHQSDVSEPLFGVDRTIRTRVKLLGEQVGLLFLSPHDCRHAWATAATRAGTSVKALQDAGGWASPAMPLRYAESAEIANDGVRLD
jgi:integrase